MKTISGKRALLVWLLLAVWSLPAVVRPVHIHHEACIAATSGEEEEHTTTHDCQQCLLCSFTLAPYVEAVVTELPPVPVFVFRQWNAVAAKGHIERHFTPTLRGPPTV
ncbi:MAG: hypothetical protein LUF04_03210 [Bacteroides sp.]|nr:hypothetical protein [Bacteroides sp.]